MTREGGVEKRCIWIVNQYTTTPQYGQGGRHYHLARELVKQGYRVRVIAAYWTHYTSVDRHWPAGQGAYILEEINAVQYLWVRVPRYRRVHGVGRIRNWFLFAWRLAGLVNFAEDRPDVVLCSAPSLISFLGARHITRKFNARLVFEVRDIWPLTLVQLGGYSPRHPFIRFLQRIEDAAYRDSELVVSNLQNAVEHMMSRGMPKEKFAWIPNGYSEDEVRDPEPLSEDVQARLPSNKFLVGYTGTVGLANALDILIEAAEHLRLVREIAFVIIGGGNEKADLQALARRKRLDNVLFIEPLPKRQVQSVLARLDVCFVGYRKNPLYRFGVAPNKLFDYLYAGKPVVYAIEPGGSLVDEIQAGISVPAEDPVATASAILNLFHRSAEERERMGANGRRYVKAHHEYGMLARRLAEVVFPNEAS